MILFVNRLFCSSTITYVGFIDRCTCIIVVSIRVPMGKDTTNKKQHVLYVSSIDYLPRFTFFRPLSWQTSGRTREGAEGKKHIRSMMSIDDEEILGSPLANSERSPDELRNRS